MKRGKVYLKKKPWKNASFFVFLNVFLFCACEAAQPRQFHYQGGANQKISLELF